MAANRLLRERAAGLGVELKVPPPELCTDNAAMIASAARWVEPLRYPDYLDLDAYATGRRHEPAQISPPAPGWRWACWRC